MLDLENSSKLQIQHNENVMEGWKRTALKSNQLTLAGIILAHIGTATKEQSDAYMRYTQGISFLAKSDIFGEFTPPALIHFGDAFRLALAAYGDWDGKPESFEQSTSSTMEGLWRDQEPVNEIKRLLQLSDELRAKQQQVSLDDAIKLKAFCDFYLINRAQREVQKSMMQRKATGPEQSPETQG